MKLFTLLTCLFFGLCALGAISNKHHFVHLKLKNREMRSKVANLIHIDTIIETSGYAVVNHFDYLQLKKKVPELIVETHEMAPTKGLKESLEDDIIEFPNGDEKYHTYKEVVSELKKHARKYPQITELFDVGSSVEGRKIVGIRITAQDLMKTNAFIPGILFTGTHHAREHLSTEVPMLLIKYLLENYEKDPSVKHLISNRDIYFIPMVNSDGVIHDIKGARYKRWRKNRALNNNSPYKGVDLNRNYGFGWGTGGSSKSPGSDVYMGPKPFSEPETIGIKNFIEGHPNIRILLTFHTFSELILYPWGGKKIGVGGQDQKIFENMAKKMSKWNKYKPMQASDLYVASGDTCDWAYGTKGIFCFTFELSPKNIWNGGFYPGTAIIDRAFRDNLKPALYLIEKAAAPYSASSEENHSK